MNTVTKQITKMAVKAYRKKLTIECGAPQAYLIERALMAYGDRMQNISPTLAEEICSMAYDLQKMMLKKGMTTESDRDVYATAMRSHGSEAA